MIERSLQNIGQTRKSILLIKHTDGLELPSAFFFSPLQNLTLLSLRPLYYSPTLSNMHPFCNQYGFFFRPFWKLFKNIYWLEQKLQIQQKILVLQTGNICNLLFNYLKQEGGIPYKQKGNLLCALLIEEVNTGGSTGQ